MSVTVKWRCAGGGGARYLRRCGQLGGAAAGLLLGQSTGECNEVIHFARTPEDKHADTPDSGLSSDIDDSPTPEDTNNLNNVLEISENWIADHAKHVTRMLPGGMFVLGLFIVSSDDVFNDAASLNKIRSILAHINRTLSSNQYMYGVPAHSERLVVHYSMDCDKLTSKSFDVDKSTSTPKSVDFKFQPSQTLWQQLDCYHEFDDIYPVITKKTGVSVREQFQHILKAAYESIESSIVFLDGKLKEGTDVLESLHKKVKGSKQSEDVPRPIQLSIYMPCEAKLPDTVEYIECEGTTHFSGIVASRIYLNPKATVDDATTAIKQDVIRSLASRFTMHCDALIDDNLLPEEKVCFNEPPRRVLIKLPEFEGKMFLCDYLFPGESPVEALMSVKEMLDTDINEDDVIYTSEFDALERNSNEEDMNMPQNANQSTYGTAIAVALVLLIIAILAQYFI
ncbi:protein odr-4 homolog isoform X2 [Arctopsyche grandis]|uniref:protein odr-4 homolog isoform X2 n=1 Tax=Arctopsyche grandis TaxID=121162 RepID=UPI00406D6575